MTTNLEQKIVFALAPTDDGPVLTLGIPKGAWEYMQDGKTHTFDLTSIGVPVKLMLFGAETHAAALQTIKDAADQQGIPLLDQRHKDWSF